MCGRFVQSCSVEQLVEEFEIDETQLDETLDPSFNLAPTQLAPVIYLEDKTSLKAMTWGIPSTFNAPSTPLINARAETLETKPSFRDLFKTNRCIVPANGFYEWVREGKSKKQPHYIYSKSRSNLAFAGLWKKAPHSASYQFTVITTEANQTLHRIHDRMPVILDPRSIALWLDSQSEPKSLKTLLKSAPENLLHHHAVSTRVNSPANNHRDLLNPALAQADLFQSMN